MEAEDEDVEDTVEVFDGLRDCSALDSSFPFIVQLLKGCSNAFFCRGEYQKNVGCNEPL